MRQNEPLFTCLPSDVLGEVMREFARRADQTGTMMLEASDVTAINRGLQEAFRVVRALENEVSTLRWENRAACDRFYDDSRKDDEALLEAFRAPNVILFPEKGS